MKKIIIITIFVIFAAITTNAHSGFLVNTVTVKTKGHFHVQGEELPFIVDAPDIDIHMITDAQNGDPGTTGSISEFGQSGQYVNSGSNSMFNAVDAVLPANWEVRANPAQGACLNLNPVSLFFQNGGIYEFMCDHNIDQTITLIPSFIDATDGNQQSASGQGKKDIGSVTALSMLAKYYKQEGSTANYTLVDTQTVYRDPNNPRAIEIPMPNYSSTGGVVDFRVVVIDEFDHHNFFAQGSFQVMYPIQSPGSGNCPGRTRQC